MILVTLEKHDGGFIDINPAQIVSLQWVDGTTMIHCSGGFTYFVQPHPDGVHSAIRAAQEAVMTTTVYATTVSTAPPTRSRC